MRFDLSSILIEYLPPTFSIHLMEKVLTLPFTTPEHFVVFFRNLYLLSSKSEFNVSKYPSNVTVESVTIK